jgi:hypothetical protein
MGREDDPGRTSWMPLVWICGVSGSLARSQRICVLRCYRWQARVAKASSVGRSTATTNTASVPENTPGRSDTPWSCLYARS